MQTTSDSALLSAVPLPAASQDFWHNDKNYASLAMDYMQVPQDLSPNVQNTMKQWTRGATDAYSALKMLEAHLSDQAVFTYSITNAPVPGNIDAVDWLLQTRSGYCTYYATTMAVMARQMGIPTRVVNGFSQGHIDQARHVWAVDGQDAHSWVQAYLPSFGWVNFDPTPGFAPNATPTSSKLPPSTKATPKPTPIITPSPAAIKNQTHPTNLTDTNDPTTNQATSRKAKLCQSGSTVRYINPGSIPVPTDFYNGYCLILVAQPLRRKQLYLCHVLAFVPYRNLGWPGSPLLTDAI